MLKQFIAKTTDEAPHWHPSSSQGGGIIPVGMVAELEGVIHLLENRKV
jgi:hypothetical protein